MTFLSFKQKDLSRILGNCNLISPKKSEVDLFTYTKIVLRGEKVEFSCINPTVFYTTKLKAESVENGVEEVMFLVKTDVFASSVNLISDDTVGVEINFDTSTLYVQGSKAKHTIRINTTDVADFMIPVENSENLEIEVRVDTKDLLDANRVAATSVGNPKVVFQPEFLNICYTVSPEENTVLVVSTDRYRLAKLVLVANFDNRRDDVEFPKNYLVSPRNMSLLAATVVDEEVITLKFESDYLWAYIGEGVLTMRYGDGNFPQYEKIIPQSFSCSFTVQTRELSEALKQVYFSARTNAINKTVTLTVKPESNEITFSSKTEDGNSSESMVNITNYEGVVDEWNQSFNADYLLDYINTVSSESLLWESNPGKPSVLSPGNQKEKQLCLVSGLR